MYRRLHTSAHDLQYAVTKNACCFADTAADHYVHRHTQQCRKHSRAKYCQSYFYYPQRLADDNDSPSVLLFAIFLFQMPCHSANC